MNTLKVSVLPTEMSLIQEGLKSEVFITLSSPKADEARSYKVGDTLEISDGNQTIKKEITDINRVGPGYFRRYKKGANIKLTEWHVRILFTEKTEENDNNTNSKPKAARPPKESEPAAKEI